MTDSVLVRLVEDGLSAPWHALKFEKALERRYNEETAPSRIRHITITGIIGGLLVMLFLVTDYTMVPDVFIQSVILRGIINPVTVLVSLFWVHRSNSVTVHETLVALLGIWAELFIIYLALKTHSLYQTDYLTGTFLIIIYVNIVGQARFAYAVAATILCLCALLGTVCALPGIPVPTAQSLILVNFATGVLTLVANFQLELRSRRNYLMTIRHQLRNADLTHNNLELRTLTDEDPLTGVYNRRALDRRIHELFHRSRNTRCPIGVIMIDVDHFKSYNDTFGHQAGDRCLQTIAAILIDETRNRRDLVARFGGEEFIIVAMEADRASVLSTAERIKATIETRAIPATQDVPSPAVVTASFGVATCDHVTENDTIRCDCTPDDLIRRADQALYLAKKSGRNRVYSAASEPG